MFYFYIKYSQRLISCHLDKKLAINPKNLKSRKSKYFAFDTSELINNTITTSTLLVGNDTISVIFTGNHYILLNILI